MFEIAVIGPRFDDRLGIVRQCLECRAQLGPDAPPCPGFGPGCLVTRTGLAGVTDVASAARDD